MRTFTTKGVLGLALLCLVLTIASSQMSPQPGSMMISTNLKYLNNIFGLVFPITMQQLLQKQTFNLDFYQGGILYSIKINKILVDSIAFDKKEIAFVPGTNKTRLTITGFDINTEVDGTIYLLKVLPLSAASLNIKNVSIVFELEAPTSDQVNWQIKDAIAIDITDVQFKLKSSIWQNMVNLAHGSIMKAVKAALPQAKALIQGKIDYINQQMAKHNSTAFLLNLMDPRFPLNMTTTRAPIMDGSTNLITLDFDGTIYDSIEKTDHVVPNTIFPERITTSDGNSHQIFIHESTLDSLFFSVGEAIFPLKLDNKNVTDQLLTFFFEIKNHYGPNIQTQLEFTILAEDGNGNFISLNKSAGIEVGKNGKASLQLMVYCSNETTKQELAVQFSMRINAVLNITEDNYYVYAQIPEIFIDNVEIMNDKVGMFGRDYNTLMTVLVQLFAQNMNDQWITPYDFRSIDPSIMFFITTVFSMPRMTPFYLDHFLYLGLSYQFDFMQVTHNEKKALESRMIDEDGEKLLKFYNILTAYYEKYLAKFDFSKIVVK